jgi:hypothetical protein
VWKCKILALDPFKDQGLNQVLLNKLMVNLDETQFKFKAGKGEIHSLYLLRRVSKSTPAPKADALPDCASRRLLKNKSFYTALAALINSSIKKLWRSK